MNEFDDMPKARVGLVEVFVDTTRPTNIIDQIAEQLINVARTARPGIGTSALGFLDYWREIVDLAVTAGVAWVEEVWKAVKERILLGKREMGIACGPFNLL